MLGQLVTNVHVFLDFPFFLFTPLILGGHNFFILALFLVVFGVSNVPIEGLPLLFGHHQ
jgi:hypothetical protein